MNVGIPLSILFGPLLVPYFSASAPLYPLLIEPLPFLDVRPLVLEQSNGRRPQINEFPCAAWATSWGGLNLAVILHLGEPPTGFPKQYICPCLR